MILRHLKSSLSFLGVMCFGLVVLVCNNDEAARIDTNSDGSSSSANQNAFPDSRWDVPPEFLDSKPVSPESIAETGNLAGEVLLKLHITKEGIVDTAWVETPSQHALLDSVALERVLTYTFSPAIKDGVPVDVYVSWPYGFYP